MNFDHFLLTQFNLRNFPKSSQTAEEQWLDWTRNRIVLFKTYCLPSILNQTAKNFSWLIYFDVSTPDEFKPFIHELSVHEFIKICYCEGIDDFDKNYFREVTRRSKPGCPWIISTRLDNDDALHERAIEIIQQNVTWKDKFLVALGSGYVLDIDRKVLAHYYYPMSPFLTLIESSSGNPTGVFTFPHAEWVDLRLRVYKEIFIEFCRPSERRSRFILNQPLWIQIFHGKNISNSFYRGLPVLKSRQLSDFGLKISTIKMRLFEFPKFGNYVLWKRYFTCWLVKVILNK